VSFPVSLEANVPELHSAKADLSNHPLQEQPRDSKGNYSHTQPFYCSSGTCPGPSGWVGTRKVKPGRLKPIWIYWSKRQWVAVASAGLYASLHLIPDNHANIPPLSFLQAACPSCRPTNSVKALKATQKAGKRQLLSNNELFLQKSLSNNYVASVKMNSWRKSIITH